LHYVLPSAAEDRRGCGQLNCDQVIVLKNVLRMSRAGEMVERIENKLTFGTRRFLVRCAVDWAGPRLNQERNRRNSYEFSHLSGGSRRGRVGDPFVLGSALTSGLKIPESTYG
jgi:hypothetical protein